MITSKFDNWISVNWSRDYSHMEDLLEILIAFFFYFYFYFFFIIIAKIDSDSNPVKTIKIIIAIKLAIWALNVDISAKIIHNCFTTTLDGQDNAEKVSDILLEDIQTNFNRLSMSKIFNVE